MIRLYLLVIVFISFELNAQDQMGWTVVMTDVGDHQQYWVTSTSFPTDEIKEKWDEGKRITSVTYGDNRWAVVMTKSDELGSQSYITSRTFPKDEIKKRWDQGKRITSVTFGNGVWAVVFTDLEDFGSQSYFTSRAFPKDKIPEKWDEGKDLTALAYGNGLWAVVMTESERFGIETVYTKLKFPVDEIAEGYGNEYAITNMVYGDGKWALALADMEGYGTQQYYYSTEFPEEQISDNWASGKDITAMAYGPIPESKPTIHTIIVGNTEDDIIGESVNVDITRFDNIFNQMANAVGFNYERQLIKGTNFSKRRVLSAVNNLSTNSNDVIIFYYSGHGFRRRFEPSDYPRMDLTINDYIGDKRRTESLNIREDVYNVLKRDHPGRLVLTVGDLCNTTDSFENDPMSNLQLSYRRDAPSRKNLSKIKRLFEAEGSMIVVSAKPDMYSNSTRDGGFFTMSFFRSLSNHIGYGSSKPADWEDIMNEALRGAAQLCTENGITPQRGFGSLNLRY